MFLGAILLDTTYYNGIDYFDSLNLYNQNHYYFQSYKPTINISDNNHHHNNYVKVIESTWQ